MGLRKNKIPPSLTEGGSWGWIVTFALPLVAANIFQSLYGAVDSFFVGQFAGAEHLAAVSLCEPVTNMLVIIISGLSAGVTVVVANQRGSGNLEEMQRTVSSSLFLYAALAVALSVLGFLFSPLILSAVQAPPEAYPHALAYLRTAFCGTGFVLGYNLMAALFRGLGNSQIAMQVVFLSSLVNVALDFVTVRLLGLGALGAALATVAAQAFSLVLCLRAFGKGYRDEVSISPRQIRCHKSSLLQVLRVGLPILVNEVMVTFAMLTVSIRANSFGVMSSAAYGVGRKIDGLAIVSDGAMNQSMAAFASQNVGADKLNRAKKGLGAAILCSGGICAVLALPVFFLAPTLAAGFNSDPAVVELAASYLRIAAFSYPLFGMVGPLIGFIRGTGNQMASVVVGFIAQYGFRVPAVLIASHFLGFRGLAIAILVGPLSSVAMYGVIVLTGYWKRGVSRISAA